MFRLFEVVPFFKRRFFRPFLSFWVVLFAGGVAVATTFLASLHFRKTISQNNGHKTRFARFFSAPPMPIV